MKYHPLKFRALIHYIRRNRHVEDFGLGLAKIFAVIIAAIFGACMMLGAGVLFFCLFKLAAKAFFE
jgi:hypothetical protein